MRKMFVILGLLGVFLLATSAAGEAVNDTASEQEVKETHNFCKIILYGGFKGKWKSDDGTKAGRLRGVYGVVKCGEREVKFFRGRWINTNTEAHGYLIGIYGDGEFKGIWGNNHVRGYLKGEYDKIKNGHFRGKWKTKDGNLTGTLSGIWMPFNPENLKKIPPFVEI